MKHLPLIAAIAFIAFSVGYLSALHSGFSKGSLYAWNQVREAASCKKDMTLFIAHDQDTSTSTRVIECRPPTEFEKKIFDLHE